MHLKSKLFSLSTLCFLSLGFLIPIWSSYFKPDFFPIGLTGTNFTGYYYVPYEGAKTPNWTWNDERNLIKGLGVNCIGSEDSWHEYLIDFAGSGAETYLDSVCIELAKTNPDTVYLITASYGAAPKRFDKNIIFKYTEANL